MKIDVEGTGVPEMYKILMGGSNYKVLDYEPWGEIPFAVFEVDPEPHTFYGRSIADILFNEQDASTSMLRGVLDNIALTNNPRTEIIDGMVNVDDLLNNEVGGVVRVKQGGSIRELVVPFVAGQVLPAMQYFDQEIESKTGVTKASSGTEPRCAAKHYCGGCKRHNPSGGRSGRGYRQKPCRGRRKASFQAYVKAGY